MATYNRYPAIDENNNFPPSVRKALSTSSEVTQAVNENVPFLVQQSMANDSNIVAAGKAAAKSSVDAFFNDALSTSDIVRGSVTAVSTPDTAEYAGGIIGANGRPTDLTVDASGKVPVPIVDEWGDRIFAGSGLSSKAIMGADEEAEGGFIGENGRETDLTLNKNGEILNRTVKKWADRLTPLIGGQIELPEPVKTPVRESHLGFSRKLYARDSSGNVRLQTSKSDSFVAWGDSLTEGFPKPPFSTNQLDSWPGVLSTLLGHPVYNGGISGQSADEIALRAAGLVLMVSPEGGSIPASGAVNVTYSGQLVGWRNDRSWSSMGTLAGIPGKLSRVAASTTLTFTRTSSGTAVPISVPTPFMSTPGLENTDATAILMLGRNDVGYAVAGTNIVDRIVNANLAIIDSLNPINPRFLILGTINATGEYVGTGNYDVVKKSNDILSQMYPDNYLDIRSYIVKESIYDQKLTPTADDLTRMGKDAPPQQIMHDGVHYTVPTAATVANRIYKELKLKGWAA